jgi:hypothetical protein
MQVDTIKSRVETAYGLSACLKLQYDEPLSSFALNFNLRRYKKDFNVSFDKISSVKGPVRDEELVRPFMDTMGGNQPRAPGTMKFAGKDTAESAQWDGTNSYDNVYSEKYTHMVWTYRLMDLCSPRHRMPSFSRLID